MKIDLDLQNKNPNIIISYAEKCEYPPYGCFRPDKLYPETPFTDISSKKNYVYDAVRNGLYLCGFDSANYGSPVWNPLSGFIKPGNTVLIKPNLVWHHNPSGGGTECLYTQPSVVSAIMDYVYIALKGKGKIIVADAPMQSCNFDVLLNESGYDRLIDYYKSKGCNIIIKDLRNLKSVVVWKTVRSSENNDVNSKIIDLKNDSEFTYLNEKENENLRITNYDPHHLNTHHNTNKHEYSIAQDILDADVIINVPKPKTHRKAGVTISMKNMIGTSTRKEFLPHHANGDIKSGGDSYLKPSLIKKIKDNLFDKRNYYMQTSHNYFLAMIYGAVIVSLNLLLRIGNTDKYYEGSWYGNDTISKTITDINKIIFFANQNGEMSNSQQRKYLIIADMIISGEKEGPLNPFPKEIGAIAIGTNPVCFDMIIGKMMGIKLDYFNTLKRALNPVGKYKFIEKDCSPSIISNNKDINGKSIHCLDKKCQWFFEPTSGWKDAFDTESRNNSNVKSCRIHRFDSRWRS